MILLNKDAVPLASSQERVEGLHRALISVHQNSIEGDFVECGVYKGGNPIIAKKFFDSVGLNKKVYCYDTFEGMTPPSDKDGDKARKDWNNKAKCEANLNEVKTNFKTHNCLDDNVKFIVGDVCKTLRTEENLPKKISILRLDTDFYESTKLELEILFPLLVKDGFLIIDDYGHWQGCQQAVDEYFSKDFVENKFERLDYAGIMYRKA